MITNHKLEDEKIVKCFVEVDIVDTHLEYLVILLSVTITYFIKNNLSKF